MECHDIQRIISERDDRPLRPDEQERLRIHVATCADCRAFERALRSGAASIASLPGIAPNPALRAAVLGKFGPSARAPRRSWLGEGAKLTAAVLAFALIGLVMATVLRPGGGDDDGPGTGGFGANPSASPTGWSAWPTSDVPPAPCVDEQVTYDVTTERATLNDDDYALLVKVTPLKATGGVECWWSASVAVTVLDAEQQPLEIQGNNSSAAVEGLLPTDIDPAMFSWHNWCGPEGPYFVELRVNESATTLHEITDAPSCEAANLPSSLGQAMMVQATPGTEDGSQYCRDDAITFEHDTNLVDGDLDITVRALTDDPACTISLKLTLSILGTDNQPLDIVNNGLDTVLQAYVPGEPAEVVYRWENWCGEAQSFAVAATTVSGDSGFSLDQAPACELPSEPSKLSALPFTSDDQPWLTPTVEVSEPPDKEPAILTPTSARPDDGFCPLIFDKRLGAAAGTHGITFIVTSNRPGCTVSATLMVTLLGSDGKPLDIEGNGLSITASATAPDVAAETTVLWQNWCGVDGPYTVQVEATSENGSGGTEFTFDAGPPCNGPELPSTLLPAATE